MPKNLSSGLLFEDRLPRPVFVERSKNKLFTVLDHEWIRNGQNLSNSNILTALADPLSANRLIGTSIGIISQARGDKTNLSLKTPAASGELFISDLFDLYFLE